MRLNDHTASMTNLSATDFWGILLGMTKCYVTKEQSFVLKHVLNTEKVNIWIAVFKMSQNQWTMSRILVYGTHLSVVQLVFSMVPQASVELWTPHMLWPGLLTCPLFPVHGKACLLEFQRPPYLYIVRWSSFQCH